MWFDFTQNNYFEIHLFFLRCSCLKKNYLSIYFSLHWVSVAVNRLSLVAVSGAILHWSVRASHFGGFSCLKHGPRSCTGSIVGAHRLNSCSTKALVAQGACNLPGTGNKPMRSAMAGRFSSTMPTREVLTYAFMCINVSSSFLLWFWFSNIPLSGYTTICLPINLLMEIWVVPVWAYYK